MGWVSTFQKRLNYKFRPLTLLTLNLPIFDIKYAKITLLRCLSEGVICHQYVFKFKNVWIWSKRGGKHFSSLNYPIGGMPWWQSNKGREGRTDGCSNSNLCNSFWRCCWYQGKQPPLRVSVRCAILWVHPPLLSVGLMTLWVLPSPLMCVHLFVDTVGACPSCVLDHLYLILFDIW